MSRTRIEAAKLAQLAAAGERLTLTIDPADLERRSALLVRDSQQACLKARLRFDEGPEGFPRMRVEVSGKLQLRCQRCLDAIAFPVRLDTRLTVLGEDAQADRLAEPFDSVAMEAGALTLETVIEDEILAALPIAPIHRAGEACASVDASPQGFVEQAGRSYRPFAELERLVAGDGDGD